MLICVAGGREYQFTARDYYALDGLVLTMLGRGIPGPVELVCGCYSGADTCGRQWAEARGYRVHKFPPDWDTYGVAAGPLRNAQMVNYMRANPPAFVVLYPGNNGTADMKKKSQEAGLVIYEAYPDGGWVCECTNWPTGPEYCPRCNMHTRPLLVSVRSKTGLIR